MSWVQASLLVAVLEAGEAFFLLRACHRRPLAPRVVQLSSCATVPVTMPVVPSEPACGK